MILALEGPDCCGKSTLFAALRKAGKLAATYVSTMPLSKELMPVMSWVEERQVQLWRALYDPAKLYVCDRTVFTSAPVYDRLFHRPALVPPGEMQGQLLVLYMEVPLEELKRRYAMRGDVYFDAEKYERLLSIYEDVLSHFNVAYLDGTRPVEQLMEDVYSYVGMFT